MSILQALRSEEVIAYPTEAVFGLGCDPDSQLAVDKLLKLKQRSWKKGLILVAANYAQLQPYIDDSVLPDEAKRAVFTSWPGPVTWLIPARSRTPNWLTGGFNTLAVRVTAHPQVKELCLAFGKPIVSTSANISGSSPCRSSQQVREQFGEQFPLLAGQVGESANPSAIRHALTGEWIRQG